MKRLALVCLLASAVAGVQAQTIPPQARIRSVEPIYENITVPRYDCRLRWNRQECTPVADVQRRISGYRVDYDYQGQRYSTVTRDPHGRMVPEPPFAEREGL